MYSLSLILLPHRIAAFVVPSTAKQKILLSEFICLAENQLQTSGGNKVTFSGIGVYRPKMFSDLPENKSAPLAPILNREISHGRMLGELATELWSDVGTRERLQHIDQLISARNQ